MSYIEKARIALKEWSDTIDIETFTKQYESLNHNSESPLLEDFKLYPFECKCHDSMRMQQHK